MLRNSLSKERRKSLASAGTDLFYWIAAIGLEKGRESIYNVGVYMYISLPSWSSATGRISLPPKQLLTS